MTLSVAVQKEVPPSPAERIRGSVEQGLLETAKRLVLDYARDVDRGLRDEAVILASRLATVTREQELFGKDIAPERAAITRAMLDLVHRIEEQEQRTPSLPPPSTRQPLQIVAAPPSSPSSGPTESPELTRLERAKLDFESGERPRPAGSSAVVECERLGKRYRRGAVAFALEDISFTLRPGEILGLVGENGSGKTTLLRIVAGEIRHGEGKLSYPSLGGNDEPLDWPAIRPRIAYVQQMPAAWYGRLRTTLQLVAAKHGSLGAENTREVDFWLHRLGLERYRNAGWDEISGGYKMRFELARAMLCKPELLILDEPLAPLDIIAQRTFLQDLNDLAASRLVPLPMLVSSQHLYEIELIANQLLFLRDGKVAYFGPPNKFESKEGGNLFELACDLGREKLERKLLALGDCRVEEFGRRFLVRTPQGVSAKALLGCIAEQGGVVEYFHDLTRSTRRLFEEGRRHD